MGSEEKYSGWVNAGVFERLKGYAKFDSAKCVVEAIDGVGASIVVSMCSEDDAPISIMMNGEEVFADVVLFSLDKEG